MARALATVSWPILLCRTGHRRTSAAVLLLRPVADKSAAGCGCEASGLDRHRKNGRLGWFHPYPRPRDSLLSVSADRLRQNAGIASDPEAVQIAGIPTPQSLDMAIPPIRPAQEHHRPPVSGRNPAGSGRGGCGNAGLETGSNEFFQPFVLDENSFFLTKRTKSLEDACTAALSGCVVGARTGPDGANGGDDFSGMVSSQSFRSGSSSFGRQGDDDFEIWVIGLLMMLPKQRGRKSSSPFGKNRDGYGRSAALKG